MSYLQMSLANGQSHWMAGIDFSEEGSAGSLNEILHSCSKESPVDEDSSNDTNPSGTCSSSSPAGFLMESKIQSHRMSSPVVFQRILNNLKDFNLQNGPARMSSSPGGLALHPVKPEISLQDPFEAFLMREFVENVAPMMNLYAFDSVFTHILPWLALNERVLFDSIMALSSLSIHSKSPGTVSREIPEKYKQAALCAIRENLESSPYSRKLLYLCSSLMVLLFNIVASDTGTVLSDLAISYEKIKELSVDREPQALEEDGARDLFVVCVGLSFSMDFIISFRFNICCSWEPEFLQAVLENEKLPHLYTNEWWLQKVFMLLARLSRFANRCRVPTYQETVENRRFNEWQGIYNDLLEYGRLLPQALKPIAQIQPHTRTTFPHVHVLDEYALLANVSYHSGVIMAMHLRPDLTPQQRLTVPPGAKDHAYQILGLLDTCDKPLFWVTIYWAHRSAAICLTQVEDREDALELSRQYEWQTGYTFSMHLALIEARWKVIDEAASA